MAEEAFVVVRLRILDSVMVGVEGLDDYLPLFIGSTSPTADLTEEVESVLTRPKVWQA